MRQTHCVVLGALLALVVFAGSAAAECAWVLWSVFPIPSEPRHEYRPREGFENKAECEAAKTKIEDTQLEEFASDERNGLQHISSSWGHRCLPDTVDPRGAKAK